MTKRFCDLCEKPMQPVDDEPFIREDAKHKVRVALLVTDLSNRGMPDVCNECKQSVVLDGVAPEDKSKSNSSTLEDEAPLPVDDPRKPLIPSMSIPVICGAGALPALFEPSAPATSEQDKPENT